MWTPRLPAGNDAIAPNEARTEGAQRRHRNWAQIAVLLPAMGALLALCGWIVAGWDGLAWSIIGGTIGLALIRRVPADVFLRAMGACPLLPGGAPGLQAGFAALCRRAEGTSGWRRNSRCPQS